MAHDGCPYIAYDRGRVDELLVRIETLIVEHGAPETIRFSPDICHQLTSNADLGRVYRNVRRTVCDTTLPPNSIIFENATQGG